MDFSVPHDNILVLISHWVLIGDWSKNDPLIKLNYIKCQSISVDKNSHKKVKFLILKQAAGHLCYGHCVHWKCNKKFFCTFCVPPDRKYSQVLLFLTSERTLVTSITQHWVSARSTDQQNERHRSSDPRRFGAYVPINCQNLM